LNRPLCGFIVTTLPHRGLFKWGPHDYWEVDIENIRWRIQDAEEICANQEVFFMWKLSPETYRELQLTLQCYIEAYYNRWLWSPPQEKRKIVIKESILNRLNINIR